MSCFSSAHETCSSSLSSVLLLFNYDVVVFSNVFWSPCPAPKKSRAIPQSLPENSEVTRSAHLHRT